MKKYVDVVAGSEEYNDILYPRCYRVFFCFFSRDCRWWINLEKSNINVDTTTDSDSTSRHPINTLVYVVLLIMNGNRWQDKSAIVQAATSWPPQICWREYGRRIIPSLLLFKVHLIPVGLTLLAFYFDIQKTHKVGQIPYVTFVHEFSERNTIYKPLQGIEKSVRQYPFITLCKGSRAFGQDYNVFIYIDMDNRFTWMPYTPVDFRVFPLANRS